MAAEITASLSIEPFITVKSSNSIYLYALCVHIVNEYVDLAYIHAGSFLNSESNLVDDAVYGGIDVGTVSYLDMQVDDKSAVSVCADGNTALFAVSLAECNSRQSSSECAYAANVCDAEAACDGMFNELNEIVL
jgi:hypothetical protein